MKTDRKIDIVGILGALGLILLMGVTVPVNKTSTGEIIETGNLTSGGVNNFQKISQYEKIITNGLIVDKQDKQLSDYPKIKINKPINNIQLVAEINFTNDFKNKYDYENSTSYFFSLKFFLGDFENGGHYDVYRKQNGGVGNSPKNGLLGAKTAAEIRDGATRYISLNNAVPIAVEATDRTPSYQFTYFNAEKYLNNNIGKEIPIGVYLSSTSEVKGRNLTYIKSLKIIYVGEKDAIEVINIK